MGNAPRRGRILALDGWSLLRAGREPIRLVGGKESVRQHPPVKILIPLPANIERERVSKYFFHPPYRVRVKRGSIPVRAFRFSPRFPSLLAVLFPARAAHSSRSMYMWLPQRPTIGRLHTINPQKHSEPSCITPQRRCSSSRLCSPSLSA